MCRVNGRTPTDWIEVVGEVFDLPPRALLIKLSYKETACLRQIIGMVLYARSLLLISK